MEQAERQGDGKTDVAIGHEKGKVMMGFPRPITWLAFDPPNAVDVAKSMIDAAVKCGMNVSLTVPKQKMNPMKQTMLVNRVDLMMRSMTEQGRKSRFIAEEIVNQVLREAP